MFDKEVTQINSSWKYIRDIKNYKKREYWQIIKKPPYVGDCEDYALSLLYLISGKSMLKFWWNLTFGPAKIRYCKVRGQGHGVLKWNKLYIDNIQKRWVTKKTLEHKGYIFSWYSFLAYETLIKLTIGKIKWRLK